MVFLMLLLPVAALANFYDVLGVFNTADQTVLRHAFKNQAIQLHPFYNPSKSTFEKFHRVALAYEILSKDRTRQVYDLYGEDSVRNEIAAFEYYSTFEELWDKYFSKREVIQDDMFAHSEVIQLGFHNLDALHNRDKFWMVVFYANDDDKSQEIGREFTQLALGLKHII